MKSATPAACFADPQEMTLIDHLGELRRRLIRAILAAVVGMAVSGCFIDFIVAFITAPAGQLYYLRPAEAFFIYVKVAMVAGIVFAAPVLFYEFWAFLVPAFTQKEHAILALLVPGSLLLFLAGTAFGFCVVLPQGLHFFLSFGDSTVQPLISVESYLDFALMLILPFGVVFNLPLVLLALAEMDVVSSAWLKAQRRFVILLAFIAAALITPTTDLVSQTLLAIPILLLYEISRLIIRYGLHK